MSILKSSIIIIFLHLSCTSSGYAASGRIGFIDASAKLNGFVHQETPPPLGGIGISGAGWLDYDNDGDLDLFLTNGIGFPNALYQNNGGEFFDVTEIAGVGNTTGNSGIVVGDIDNDGYADLLLTGEGHLAFIHQSPTILYHNNGDGTFSDISATANIPGGTTTLAAAMGDINNDGYLDIFITAPGHGDGSALFGLPPGSLGGPALNHPNKLYLNNGDLTFKEISESAGVDDVLGACVVSFHDYDLDGLTDIYVGNCLEVNAIPTPFHLYRNNGNLTFTDIAAQTGLDQTGFWMSVTFGDYDNDGDEDLFATNTGTNPNIPPEVDPYFDSRQHALFRRNSDGTYTDVAEQFNMDGLASVEFGWGATFADFNNDGYLDLYFAGALPALDYIGPGFGNPGRLYINDKNSGFNEAPKSRMALDLSARYTSGVAKGDYNNDGFVDLLIKTATLTNPLTNELLDLGTPVLLQNLGNQNRWITVRLQNKAGHSPVVGAVIECRSASGRQIRQVYAGSSFASNESPWPIFGVGRDRSVVLWVTWPSGKREFFGQFSTKQTIQLVEGQGRATHPIHRGVRRYGDKHGRFCPTRAHR